MSGIWLREREIKKKNYLKTKVISFLFDQELTEVDDKYDLTLSK